MNRGTQESGMNQHLCYAQKLLLKLTVHFCQDAGPTNELLRWLLVSGRVPMNRFHPFSPVQRPLPFQKYAPPQWLRFLSPDGESRRFRGWQIQVENWIWLAFESTLPIRFSNFCCSLQQPDSLEISLKIQKRLDFCSKSLNLRILQMDRCESQILPWTCQCRRFGISGNSTPLKTNTTLKNPHVQ